MIVGPEAPLLSPERFWEAKSWCVDVDGAQGKGECWEEPEGCFPTYPYPLYVQG